MYKEWITYLYNILVLCCAGGGGLLLFRLARVYEKFKYNNNAIILSSSRTV